MKKVTTNSLWGMFCVRSLMLMAILGFSLVGSDAYAKGTGTKDDPFIFEDGGSYSLDGLKNKPVYAQFVVPEDVTTDGVKLEVVTPQDMGIYTDETFQTEVATTVLVRSRLSLTPLIFPMAQRRAPLTISMIVL